MRLRPPILVLATILAVMLLGAHTIRGPALGEVGVGQDKSRNLSITLASSEKKTPRPRGASPAEAGRGQVPVAADHPPVQPSPEAEGETWTEGEIIAAHEECAHLLGPVGVGVEISKPIRTGQCGTPAPVMLRRVAGVEITPPAVVNCRIAAKLNEWVEKKLQPLAREMLDTAVGRIVNASAYTCRQRIGNPKRLSEHSFANALDISAFVMTDGRTIDVLTHWGRTARDLRAQAKVGEGTKMAGGDAQPLSDAQPAVPTPSPESLFLRRTHVAACGHFATVLGPEANEAHRNHFHLDLAARRRNAFCE